MFRLLYQPFGRLPTFFSRMYPNDVSMHAELLDPVGNLNFLRVEKIGKDCYFTNGWAHFCRFYGLQLGGWLKLVYVRRGHFEIKIKTYKFVEWIYPPIPEPLEGGFGTGGLDESIGDEDRLIVNNSAFPYRMVKWVSFAEYTGDVMVSCHSKVFVDNSNP